MVRKRDYTEDEAAKVVDMLASGRTFRGTAHDCGMTLGMVQRIWENHMQSMCAEEDSDD